MFEVAKIAAAIVVALIAKDAVDRGVQAIKEKVADRMNDKQPAEPVKS